MKKIILTMIFATATAQAATYPKLTSLTRGPVGPSRQVKNTTCTIESGTVEIITRRGPVKIGRSEKPVKWTDEVSNSAAVDSLLEAAGKSPIKYKGGVPTPGASMVSIEGAYKEVKNSKVKIVLLYQKNVYTNPSPEAKTLVKFLNANCAEEK